MTSHGDPRGDLPSSLKRIYCYNVHLVTLLQAKSEALSGLGDPNSTVHGANMGPTWGDRTQVGPMLATWALLSGDFMIARRQKCSFRRETHTTEFAFKEAIRHFGMISVSWTQKHIYTPCILPSHHIYSWYQYSTPSQVEVQFNVILVILIRAEM